MTFVDLAGSERVAEKLGRTKYEFSGV